MKPIAIIGAGCRFAGCDDVASLWRMLLSGTDAIEKVPRSRFDVDAFYDGRPGTPGKIVSREGGFVRGIEEFDARFFGISPREAQVMDPQQRLLLEVAWEALEDAGQVPARLAAHATAVFIGMMENEYCRRFRAVDEVDLLGLVGGSRDAAAGRISHLLGLKGPSLVVSADRSSSLAAVYLACRSLERGEARLALAGGVNLVLAPEPSVAFSRARMLAPDGRCKFGDARADGFVRAEGVGIVALKPLALAQADGDPIYAVITGGALNHCGGSSGDLMTPSQSAQEAVLRSAYADAGLLDSEVDYVEAHGVGTPVGDPIELAALGAVLGRGRAMDRRLHVGSVKTNIGHAEAAAGVAGLIKVALMLKNRFAPASLHCELPNPAIPFEQLGIAIQRGATSLGPPSRPARAGVSSFGLTGTNAHLVLTSPEGASGAAPPDEARRAELFMLSARSRRSLELLATAYASCLGDEAPAASLGDICYTASERRAHHDQRLAIVAQTTAELRSRLGVFLEGEPSRSIAAGTAASGKRPRVVFVCPGQGSQWRGMGRRLLAEEPVFRRAIEDCDRAFRRHVDWSLIDQLTDTTDSCRLAEIDVVQPCLFAMSIGLAALWRAWGVEPDAIVGTSMGEVAAAALAGVLSLDDAARVICVRSQLLRRLRGLGAMAVTQASVDEAERLVAEHQGKIAIAAINSPTSTVLSGDEEALRSLVQRLDDVGRFARLISVDVASHSPHVDPLQHELAKALDGISARGADLPFFSTVTGAELAGERCDPSYWWRNLREPVRFAPTVRELLSHGTTVFLELSPHPVLWDPLVDCLHHFGGDGVSLQSLRRGEDERTVLLESAGRLYTLGFAISWDRLYPARAGHHVRVPTYRWDRERFWYDGHEEGEPSVARSQVAAEEERRASAISGASARRTPVVERLDVASAVERRALLSELVPAELRKVLKLGEGSELDTRRPFRELGVTSLLATEVTSHLASALGRSFPATLLFNYPTIDRLIDHLAGGERPDTDPAASSVGSAAAFAEPIAIVGMACRFPGGADTPEDFARFLFEGRDAVTEVPRERWAIDKLNEHDVAQYTACRWGAFLGDVAGFDAGFFGIAPREAERMDPRQRILLEVTWEALERASQAPDRLAGTPTGVFLGMMGSEYASVKGLNGRLSSISAFDGTGDACSVAAGRISYTLGLVGPSVAIDTACSSSLVAVHLACQSLRTRECKMALAGGINLMLDPALTVAYAKARMLAPDGRCRSFDAAASGYVRGEGCGIVVLKRLSDAQADGDEILALIRGSAVNQDGRTSGLTAPSGRSQEALIRTALAQAGLEPRDVQYVEAHGTGTPLGDPIEMQALAAALGRDRAGEEPLHVGSVKTNIGHLEAAAGIAGLVKALIALGSERIPENLHFERGNPRIPFEQLSVAVPTATTPWPRAAARRRIAGVSSFGFSGTNAHVLVEEAPLRPAARLPAERPAHLLALSARTEAALGASSARMADFLAGASGSLGDICFSANTGRSRFSHRAAVLGSSTGELARKLAAIGAGETPDLSFRGRAPQGREAQLAFVFTGHGARHPGAGRALYETTPVFRATIDRCSELLKGRLRRPLLDVLWGEAPDTVGDTDEAGPALFVLQYAVAETFRALGIAPRAVLADGVGEYAGACVAGMFSLEEALSLVADRGGAACIGGRAPQVAFVSSATGDVIDHGSSRSAWRCPGAQETSRLSDGVSTLHRLGCRILLEIGPSPARPGATRDEWPAGAGEAVRLDMLLEGENEYEQLLRALAQLHVAGMDISWAELDRGYPRRKVILPTYPFERERCWVSGTPA
ncbi:beta-ketoacyl synthase N-terminal-like domain-containing protein [Sorangium sp. So ce269]